MILQKDSIMFRKNWENIVQNGFNKIFSYMKNDNNGIPFQMQMNEVLKQYNLIYEICMSRNSEIRKLCEVNLEEQLRKYCCSFLEESENKIDLKNFILKWTSYSGVLYNWLKKTFKYYDNMKKMMNKSSSLKDQVFNIYKVQVYDKLKDNLYTEFENMVNLYRSNKEIDVNICKEYIQFLKLFKEDG